MKCPLTAATPVRLALLAALGVAATAANAQSMVTARVLGAQPVVEQVPVQECGPNRASGTGAAVGAVTGGLIGSQIGRGNGHIAGAILGALGGAVLGNTAEAYNNGYGGCATRYSQRVTGYDVVYEVAGRSYQTRMAQAPGQWIQVPAPDAYHGQPAWGAGEVQSYPVAPPSLAGYPMPVYPAAGESSGVVTAPPAWGGQPYPVPYPGGYGPVVPQGDAAPYPPAYAPPAYPVYPAYPPAAYAPPPVRYVAPVGVNLSIGGVIGGRGRGHGHWGVGIGSGW